MDHFNYCCCSNFHQGEPGFLGPQGEPGLPGLPGTKVGGFYLNDLEVLREFQIISSMCLSKYSNLL